MKLLLGLLSLLALCLLALVLLSRPRTKSLVVAYCKEQNLDWLKNHTEPVYLYSKCGQTVPEFVTKMQNVKVIPLKNLGGCDGTYLYHIVNEWDNLTDYIGFTTANPTGKRAAAYEQIRRGQLVFALQGPRRTPDTFRLDDYRPDSHPDVPYTKSKYRDLKDFVVRVLGQDTFDKFNTESFLGVFAVTREQVHRNSRNMYRRLLDEVSIGPSNEVGHFIERLWYLLMNHTVFFASNST
jgi:Protein of unknown function (DUF3431)